MDLQSEVTGAANVEISLEAALADGYITTGSVSSAIRRLVRFKKHASRSGYPFNAGGAHGRRYVGEAEIA